MCLLKIRNRPIRRFLLRAGCLAGSFFLLFPREAVALIPFMDGGVFLNVEGGGRYDTNVFANANEEGDFYLRLMPELQYLREEGVLNLDARIGFEALRFNDLSDQDTEDFFSSLTLTYPNRPGENPRGVEFDIAWYQDSSTREDIGDRARSDIFKASLSGRRDVSDRLALRGGGTFGTEEFSQGRFSSIDTWILSGDAVHIFSDNLETFIGYRYRNTKTSGDSNEPMKIGDHLLHIGAEGQLTARTVGFVSVGIQNRMFSEGNNDDELRPYGAASVVWTPASRTAVTLIGSKDFSVTPDERSIDKTTIRVILNQGVYGRFSVEPSLSYVNSKLVRSNGSSRQNDRYEIALGLIYELASGAVLATEYSFRKQTSDDAFFEYDRHTLDLLARFTF